PIGGLITSGNVGIGSLSPGQALDVQGTVRTISFAMSGQTPISGYVLTASDSAGDTTWTSPGAVSGWTISGNDVYETLQGNVGIGTTTVNQAALSVTNGNVGIGTWTTAGGSLIVATGNVGIGSVWPGTELDIQGTVRLSANLEQGGAVASGTNNATALGSTQAGGTITSSGTGSLAEGWANRAGGVSAGVLSNGIGSIADGWVQSVITTSSIQSSGQGSLAIGSASEAGSPTTITASNAGSVAMGYVVNNTLQSTGIASFAMGYANGAGPLQATGLASFAMGQSVQATADNTFALGSNFINNNLNTFMVGFGQPTLTVTSANVGIGTIAPVAALGIVGNIGIGTGINSP
ncbi:MAG: hypothetical protein ACREGC_04050, partial [Minisyncoccia bacterium]